MGKYLKLANYMSGMTSAKVGMKSIYINVFKIELKSIYFERLILQNGAL